MSFISHGNLKNGTILSGNMSVGHIIGNAWFNDPIDLGLDGVLPKMVAQYDMDRYAVNGILKTFDELHTFARSTTATFEDINGVIQTAVIDASRFDYRNGVAQGLLLEDAATNLQIWSNEDPVTGGYTELNSTTSATVSSTPINGINAPHHIHNSTNALHYIRPSRYLGVETMYSYVIGQTYTFSGFIFSSDSSVLHTLFFEKPDATIFSSWGSDQMLLNLATGEVTGSQAADVSVQDFGGGWFRYSVTKTADASGSARVHPILYLNVYGNSAGDDVAYIKLIGVQTEIGTFATSYIPTSGSSVTRAADICKIDGTRFTDFWDADRGTIYIEQDIDFQVDFSSLIIANDTTTNEFIKLQVSSAGLGSVDMTDGAVGQVSINVGLNIIDIINKEAVSYELNNTNIASGGISGTTDASCTIPTVTQLDILNFNAGSLTNGHVKEIRYYDIRGTNTGLEALTTADPYSHEYSDDYA